jgi:hypothetical protein
MNWIVSVGRLKQTSDAMSGANMNIRKGLFRLWLIFAVLFVGYKLYSDRVAIRDEFDQMDEVNFYKAVRARLVEWDRGGTRTNRSGFYMWKI